MAVPSCLPKTTYALPSLFESSLTPIIKSSKPITYTDINGSESESATASLSVAFQRGFVINGETADDLVGMSISSAGDVKLLLLLPHQQGQKHLRFC
jgi:hypothetical protein